MTGFRCHPMSPTLKALSGFPCSVTLVFCCPMSIAYFCTQDNISIFSEKWQICRSVAGWRLSLFRNYPLYTQRVRAQPPSGTDICHSHRSSPLGANGKELHTGSGWRRKAVHIGAVRTQLLQEACSPFSWLAGKH